MARRDDMTKVSFRVSIDEKNNLYSSIKKELQVKMILLN